MSPHLTPEQKEHLKIAHRANMRIEETWSLFCMYLSQDKRPIEALELARNAVSVWADWMDVNEVEPPEIERPDFGQQIVDSMGKMFEKLPKGIAPWPYVPGQIAPVEAAQVDAEFIPAEQHGADPTSTALSNPENLSRQDPPKND